MAFNGINIPNLVDTTVINTTVINNFNTTISGSGIGVAAIAVSGKPSVQGTIGATGLGGIKVDLLSGVGAFGFSGLLTFSGAVPFGTYFFAIPDVLTTSNNSLIPDLYVNDGSNLYEFTATLKTAAQGQGVSGFVTKNGTNLFGFLVPTGVTKYNTPVAFSVISGDVLSATLSQVGTTTPGTTLTLGINVTK